MAGGTPVWSEKNGSYVASRPSWKAPAEQIGTTRAVVRAAGPDGVALMPIAFMRIVPMLSADVHAVSPNHHYLSLVPAPPEFIEDRRLLNAAVRGPRSRKPGLEEFRRALGRVGVTVACTLPWDRRGIALLDAAGWTERKRIRMLVCSFPPKG
ncbi:hypothetical protein E1298_08820 [Actinomadura rubrisoli]|uniref:Uncharacterized protein n=1 Tax=Actinomadura rubrisoli TaxID=2530368 RepID=A0A4R5C203_9ACTN|nr:hypothetical protein E1298_08820 [Actinomadura rubrisoli]